MHSPEGEGCCRCGPFVREGKNQLRQVVGQARRAPEWGGSMLMVKAKPFDL